MISKVITVLAIACVVYGVNVIMLATRSKDKTNIAVGAILILVACLKLGEII